MSLKLLILFSQILHKNYKGTYQHMYYRKITTKPKPPIVVVHVHELFNPVN